MNLDGFLINRRGRYKSQNKNRKSIFKQIHLNLHVIDLISSENDSNEWIGDENIGLGSIIKQYKILYFSRLFKNLDNFFYLSLICVLI